MSQVLGLSDIERFVDQLFASTDEVKKGSAVIKGILDARSIRLSDVAQKIEGKSQANYKAIQRYLEAASPEEGLLRLYQEDAPFVLADPTEIARPQAKKTAYVGRLKDGKTRGFWLLLLATPYRGRTIPFHFITYSSSTIAEESTSRNQEHSRALSPSATLRWATESDDRGQARGAGSEVQLRTVAAGLGRGEDQLRDPALEESPKETT